jgi:uncharacterized protein YdaT
MLWQYDYILSHGTVYNFMTGFNYIESSSGALPINPSKEREDNQERDKNDIDEVLKEFESDAQGGVASTTGQSTITTVDSLRDNQNGAAASAHSGANISDDSTPQGNANKGIWDSTIARIKGNILTFVILMLLLAALSFVLVYRKINAIKNDSG